MFVINEKHKKLSLESIWLIFKKFIFLFKINLLLTSFIKLNKKSDRFTVKYIRVIGLIF